MVGLALCALEAYSHQFSNGPGLYLYSRVHNLGANVLCASLITPSIHYFFAEDVKQGGVELLMGAALGTVIHIAKDCFRDYLYSFN